jgi:hypothetical protein
MSMPPKEDFLDGVVILLGIAINVILFLFLRAIVTG